MDKYLDALLDDLNKRIDRYPVLAEFDLPAIGLPSIRLVTKRAPYGRLGIGDTRIGGKPDVVPGFEWPRWSSNQQANDKYGQPWNPKEPTPLGFIAQIDLGTIPRLDGALPDTGWLYFFYDRYCEPWGFDPADRGCCRVVYENSDRSKLERVNPPRDADPEHTAEPCVVQDWPELTLPDNLPGIQYGTDAFVAYEKLREELSRGGGSWQHRLFGHPQPIQGSMERECQLASNGVFCGSPEGYKGDRARALEQGAADWRLLLQIDTDEEGPGWMWGDVGRIYFWIKRQDLSRLRFDDVWLVFQCY